MNAIIMAAGTASRFVPLSAERPKGLLEVKGEILIERQIRQLQEAGIQDITLVLGYKADMFAYLKDRFGVRTVLNEDYARYNNTSSIVRVLDLLDETFICCSDHYFRDNVFLDAPQSSYYAARYAQGSTDEYCLEINENGFITDVHIGGKDAWYMAGQVFFNPSFSNTFRKIMYEEYEKEENRLVYWEDIYIRHIHELPMMARKYDDSAVLEFDSIDELRQFDESYLDDTRSSIVKEVARKFQCRERELSHFSRVKHEGDYVLFTFQFKGDTFLYDGRDQSIRKV